MLSEGVIKALGATAGLLLIGLLAWRRARYRVGVTPRCARCEYILVGAADRCSECGTELFPAGVAHGERRRDPVLAALAVTLWIGAALPLVVIVRSIDWNEWRPAGSLMRDLGSSNQQTADRAFVELNGRAAHGWLSSANEERLIDLSLKELTSPVPSRARHWLLEFLFTRAMAGQLTPAQRARFVDGVIDVKLTIRTPVRPGSHIRLTLLNLGRGSRQWHPAERLYCRLGDGELRLDGKPMPRSRVDANATFCGDGSSYRGEMDLPPQPIGHHVVTIDVPVTISPGRRLDQDDCPALATVTRRLTAAFDVVSDAGPTTQH